MGDAKLAQQPPPHAIENAGDRWMAAMARGDFAAAFAENDRVLAARDPAGRDDPALPYHLRWVWDGRPLDGQEVLVRCYHGLGDTLQFARYLAPLRRRAKRVTVEVPAALLELLAALPGPDRLIPFDPARPARPACDIEVMELAHALRLPPDPAPYLPCPAVPRREGGLRVGLCWHVASAWQPERSVPLPLLATLGEVPGVTLVSLQRGPGAAALSEPGAPSVANPGDRSTDIMATVRLLAGLDLVVTIDTMVAHLAGALGLPVWLLLLHQPDWRWLAGGLAGGRGSPWYRGIRKYPQPQPGDWAGAARAVYEDLTGLAIATSVRGGTRLAHTGL